MCEQTGRCNPPPPLLPHTRTHRPPNPQTQCIFTAGRVVAPCGEGRGRGSTFSLQQPADTKEQWERQSERSQGEIINPGGVWEDGVGWGVHRFSGTLRYQWEQDSSERHTEWLDTRKQTKEQTLISPSRRSAARNPGWCRWAAQAAATTTWSCSWWSWSGAWWELWRELQGTGRTTQWVCLAVAGLFYICVCVCLEQWVRKCFFSSSGRF